MKILNKIKVQDKILNKTNQIYKYIIPSSRGEGAGDLLNIPGCPVASWRTKAGGRGPAGTRPAKEAGGRRAPGGSRSDWGAG